MEAQRMTYLNGSEIAVITSTDCARERVTEFAIHGPIVDGQFTMFFHCAGNLIQLRISAEDLAAMQRTISAQVTEHLDSLPPTEDPEELTRRLYLAQSIAPTK